MTSNHIATSFPEVCLVEGLRLEISRCALNSKKKFVYVPINKILMFFVLNRISVQLRLPPPMKIMALAANIIHHSKVVVRKKRGLSSNRNPVVYSNPGFIWTSFCDAYSLPFLNEKQKNKNNMSVGGCHFYYRDAEDFMYVIVRIIESIEFEKKKVVRVTNNKKKMIGYFETQISQTDSNLMERTIKVVELCLENNILEALEIAQDTLANIVIECCESFEVESHEVSSINGILDIAKLDKITKMYSATYPANLSEAVRAAEEM